VQVLAQLALAIFEQPGNGAGLEARAQAVAALREGQF